jgi:hypothetical protein
MAISNRVIRSQSDKFGSGVKFLSRDVPIQKALKKEFWKIVKEGFSRPFF